MPQAVPLDSLVSCGHKTSSKSYCESFYLSNMAAYGRLKKFGVPEIEVFEMGILAATRYGLEWQTHRNTKDLKGVYPVG